MPGAMQNCLPSSPVARRGIAVLMIALLLSARPVAAASLSRVELDILSKSLTFLQPKPIGDVTVAIVYADGNAGSRQDAQAIADAIGGGLIAGGAVLRPKLVDVAALSTAEFALVIVAAGANDEAVMRAARRYHALCVTGDLAAVRAGTCVMAIRSEDRVEILLNSQAAQGAGIAFAIAFRMMVQEQ
jgi:hypothetical protein